MQNLNGIKYRLHHTANIFWTYYQKKTILKSIFSTYQKKLYSFNQSIKTYKYKIFFIILLRREVLLHIIVLPFIFFIKSLKKITTTIPLITEIYNTTHTYLNSSSFIMGNFNIKKIYAPIQKIWSNKIPPLIIGLFAIILTFYNKNQWELTLSDLRLYIVGLLPPFLLLIFGYKNASRIMLIGIMMGLLMIIIWNKWIEPLAPIHKVFLGITLCILAMINIHYFFSYAANKKWDRTHNKLHPIATNYPHRYNEKRNKNALRSILIDLKTYLAKIHPRIHMLIGMGIYVMITNFLMMATKRITENFIYWIMLQLMAGASFLGWGIFIPPTKTPRWTGGLYWLISIIFCFPINIFWHLRSTEIPALSLSIALIHLTIVLWILPLYLDMVIVGITLLISIFIYCIKPPIVWPSPATLLFLLLISALILVIIMYNKLKIISYTNQISYLKDKQKLRYEQKLKNIAYNLHLKLSPKASSLQEAGIILEKVLKDVTQSISFLNDNPLYKQDFESIINKFYDWAVFLKKQTNSTEHILLLPTEITIEELIHKLEVTLERELSHSPRLFIEKIETVAPPLPTTITWDVQQIINLLFTAILRIAKLEQLETYLIKIQFHPTYIQYANYDTVDLTSHSEMKFPAIAIVIINHSTTHTTTPPRVKNLYNYITDKPNNKNSQRTPLSIDLGARTMERIIHAHYGYLETSHSESILVVLPWYVTHIRDEMMARLPIEYLNSETAITDKEQKRSILTLMEFHDFICKITPVEPGVIAEILLLLRQYCGFKRHASGELFYIRAVGIAKLMATWISSSSKVIYAVLLHDLIRYTNLPFSYIKANYDKDISTLVEEVLSLDKCPEAALKGICTDKYRKNTASSEQILAIYIKLARQLYDLRNASGYTDIKEIKPVIQSVFTIDLELANHYLGDKIALELEATARQAEEVCKKKDIL